MAPNAQVIRLFKCSKLCIQLETIGEIVSQLNSRTTRNSFCFYGNFKAHEKYGFLVFILNSMEIIQERILCHLPSICRLWPCDADRIQTVDTLYSQGNDT
ncbi:hypothetical protein T4B_3568 [Trichinella pseudospiralis]|uniref:Uncharacterized protein n=2 Tax=Trichinella pseudospiralis TaxID=6337 RepID=A0A0V1FBC8_TRIPS|nr:hypothetical protein T4D_15700 [Trichinella pseudospiralis]KRZ14575.1 hypothetical protein T4B_3568 [Trichinella pseudospiralis]